MSLPDCLAVEERPVDARLKEKIRRYTRSDIFRRASDSRARVVTTARRVAIARGHERAHEMAFKATLERFA